MKKITVCFCDQNAECINFWTKKLNISKSEFIRDAIGQYIEIQTAYIEKEKHTKQLLKNNDK